MRLALDTYYYEDREELLDMHYQLKFPENKLSFNPSSLNPKKHPEIYKWFKGLDKTLLLFLCLGFACAWYLDRLVS